MRCILTIILIFLFRVSALAQSDSASNSFETIYKKANPTIHYKYGNKKQVHDYSNNWDFDKDGKTDNVYFIGTGGAHLYYYLRVVLSSDNIVRNFPFIQSDFPVLPKDDELNKIGYRPGKKQTYFAVFNDGN